MKRSELDCVAVVNGLKYLVLALEQGAETKTKAGVIIPSTAKEDWTKYGRIVAEGDGEYTADGKFHGCKYGVGDVVYFDRYTGKVHMEGVDYRLVPEREVVFRVTPGTREHARIMDAYNSDAEAVGAPRVA